MTPIAGYKMQNNPFVKNPAAKIPIFL